MSMQEEACTRAKEALVRANELGIIIGDTKFDNFLIQYVTFSELS